MVRLPVQLSMQLTTSIMMLSAFISILLSLSRAASLRADTFTKGIMPLVHEPDGYSNSAVWILSKNEANSQSANEMQAVKGPSTSSSFEAEESRRGPYSTWSSHVISNVDHEQLQRGSSVKAILLHGLPPADWLAEECLEEDEYLQLLQQVALMTRANIPPLGMWQITADEEVSYRSTCLIMAVVLGADTHRDAKMVTDDILPLLQEVNLPTRKALQVDISPPGMWQGNDDQLDAKSGKRALLADISSPGIWTDAEVNESRLQKRRLLADISPPGMWSDDGDDTQDKYHKRRLLAHISRPGMWQGSDDRLTYGSKIMCR